MKRHLASTRRHSWRAPYWRRGTLGILSLVTGCATPTPPARPTLSPEPAGEATHVGPLKVKSSTQAPVVALDPHSFARPVEARVTHVALDLTVDFTSRVLFGTATLSIARAPGAAEVVLDTSGLTIAAVTTGDGRALAYKLGDAHPVLGRPLAVALPTALDRLVVRYQTSPDAGALQWLLPEQTAGKKYPYLFSQGQAILTRSWIPTQDSPGIRQTYEAKLRVPVPLTALMSAEMLTPGGVQDEHGRCFSFRTKEPIAPYLVALAVGDIGFRALGPRTGVYAEPAVLTRAAYEFAELEKMLLAAESIGGPYRWGRYDVLVLPPSFPYGGMENPRLTFVSPTVLAGDRSLVSLAAHELAHSWSGNLATNATWGDIWLNEGFTSYFELRIMEASAGKERAAMLELLGRRGLEAELRTLPARDTILNMDLSGRNPDAASAVAYDKGAAFLRTLEAGVGREHFDRWFLGYFERHAFRSVTTASFLEDLRKHLLHGDRAMEESLLIKAWLSDPGLPANAYQPVSEAFSNVERQAEAFVKGAPARTLITLGWSPQEWQHFLETLFQKELTSARVRELDDALALSKSQNAEILFAWLRLALKYRHERALPALERFLTSQGRRKFLRPLYTDLMQSDWGRAHARRIYKIARPTYHPVSAQTIDTIVR